MTASNRANLVITMLMLTMFAIHYIKGNTGFTILFFVLAFLNGAMYIFAPERKE